ncbi:ABC transporter ATP-binding protein [Methanococcoides sp. AM1]|uniref:ABC transporter ATP-binding protein n=1 Tax=Methanococcoides sp. AM1 TaxID=1201011 RepID=UPI0010827AB8|nr:ABC transporter ATP-binding protein [Methanococcoides sp. AM1]
MIVVKDLKRYYGSGETAVKALNGVSFEINKGEFVAIMGASGSGKTTLLRILALLDDATAGEYTIRGLQVSSLPEAERSYYRLTQVGYVFQDYALINEMTSAENVYVLSMMEGKSKKESYNTALEALDKVGMKDKYDRVPDELSGGEKQRVAIARAIAKKPDIMFADEPCANLDTRNSKQVLDVFKELNDNYGQTIIMVTHEPWHTEYVDRVITLEDGILVSDEQVNEKEANDV